MTHSNQITYAINSSWHKPPYQSHFKGDHFMLLTHTCIEIHATFCAHKYHTNFTVLWAMLDSSIVFVHEPLYNAVLVWGLLSHPL